MENEYLKQQNGVLLKLKNMSIANIKTLIESRESINNTLSLFNAMTRKTF